MLDVGSGSGYLTACFARAISSLEEPNNALVVGIEHQPELVKKGVDNINKDDPTLIDSRKIVIVGMCKRFLFSKFDSNFNAFVCSTKINRGRWSTWIFGGGKLKSLDIFVDRCILSVLMIV